jgi:putative tryptophan/tyrosine transport system substrate-binding protein
VRDLGEFDRAFLVMRWECGGAAIYVDKILKGTKPAGLSVEPPIKFEFVINLRSAKQVGLTIPKAILYRGG